MRTTRAHPFTRGQQHGGKPACREPSPSAWRRSWCLALCASVPITNKRVFQNPLTPKEAAEHIRSWQAQPVVEILEPQADHVTQVLGLLETLSTAESRDRCAAHCPRHRAWCDAAYRGWGFSAVSRITLAQSHNGCCQQRSVEKQVFVSEPLRGRQRWHCGSGFTARAITRASNLFPGSAGSTSRFHPGCKR